MKYFLLISLLMWVLVAAVTVNAYWIAHKPNNTRDVILLIEDWHWQDSIKYNEGDVVKYQGKVYERSFVANGRVTKAPGDNPFWYQK